MVNENKIIESEIIYNEQRANEEFKAISKALSMAHSATSAIFKSKEINKALKSDNRDYKIEILLKYINKYKFFINSIKNITGIQVIDKIDFYLEKTVDIINLDLQFIKNIVYANDAFNYGLGEVVKKALKKIFNAYKKDNTEE
ncbi:MAG: hypothetical protein R3Y28_04830 [Candidatus Gastranaerophilales bacterium]